MPLATRAGPDAGGSLDSSVKHDDHALRVCHCHAYSAFYAFIDLEIGAKTLAVPSCVAFSPNVLGARGARSHFLGDLRVRGVGRRSPAGGAEISKNAETELCRILCEPGMGWLPRRGGAYSQKRRDGALDFFRGGPGRAKHQPEKGAELSRFRSQRSLDYLWR